MSPVGRLPIAIDPPLSQEILSAPPERQWATPAAQWAAGREAIALGDGTAVARWTAQCCRSGASDEVTFLYFQTCVFFRSYAGAYNRLIRFFFGVFFLADLSYVGFVLVGNFLDIQQ